MIKMGNLACLKFHTDGLLFSKRVNRQLRHRKKWKLTGKKCTTGSNIPLPITDGLALQYYLRITRITSERMIGVHFE